MLLLKAINKFPLASPLKNPSSFLHISYLEGSVRWEGRLAAFYRRFQIYVGPATRWSLDPPPKRDITSKSSLMLLENVHVPASFSEKSGNLHTNYEYD